jgi:hypothetical protein
MRLPTPKLLELVPAMLAAGVLLYAAIDRAHGQASAPPTQPTAGACRMAWDVKTKNANQALFPTCLRGGVL